VTALSTAAGILLVGIALRDVFETIFHPQGRGLVSQSLIRCSWRGIRRPARGDHQVLSLAGPLAFVMVLATWGALTIVGFALIFWPHAPEGFVHAEGVQAGGGFDDALYLSMVNLTSLGYGDIVPSGELLRFVGPLETLIGLGLLTAGISWILLLYRGLADNRSLSHEISLLSDAEGSTEIGVAGIEPLVAARILGDLTTRTVAVRDDLVHSPISYYFHPRDRRHALPLLLPRLLALVEECSQQGRDPAVRFQAGMLRSSLEDLLETIAVDFVSIRPGDTAEALAAYQRDHLWVAGDRG
jgi:hypothetical protein